MGNEKKISQYASRDDDIQVWDNCDRKSQPPSKFSLFLKCEPFHQKLQVTIFSRARSFQARRISKAILSPMLILCWYFAFAYCDPTP